MLDEEGCYVTEDEGDDSELEEPPTPDCRCKCPSCMPSRARSLTPEPQPEKVVPPTVKVDVLSVQLPGKLKVSCRTSYAFCDM